METIPPFVQAFDAYLTSAAIGCACIAVLILLYHEFRVFLIKDYKAKYDYVNVNEIKYFWYSVMALILGIALYLNSLATSISSSVFANVETWFYVRTIMTLFFVVIAYFIFYSLVRIYYPRYVEKRLNRLRNKPRISPAGNLMRKLREAEEEAHLEAAQWAEQKEIHSVDYDVWLDEKTGYKKIEKYFSYQHVEECPECGYVTLKMTREEVARSPSEDETGLLVKHYKCTFCNHRVAKEALIAALSANVTDTASTEAAAVK